MVLQRKPLKNGDRKVNNNNDKSGQCNQNLDCRVFYNY